MSMEKMRDSIDFKNTDIKTLFRKLLLPTVLGMIFSALFVITDGIFVGKGIGSDALAAVNIVAPLWLFSTCGTYVRRRRLCGSLHSSVTRKGQGGTHQYHAVGSHIFLVADVHLHPILFICPAGGKAARRV